MKKTLLSLTLSLVLAVFAFPGATQAELIDAPSSAFLPTAPLNLANLLLQQLGSDDPIPIDFDLGGFDCPFAGSISASMHGTITFVDPAYGVWFEPTQNDDLIVKAETGALGLAGDLSLHADNCMGFLNFDWDVAGSSISADKMVLHFQADTLYNTATDKVVLESIATQLLILECLEWSGEECLNWSLNFDIGGDWPGHLEDLKDIIEGWLAGAICINLAEAIGEQGDLATVGDGGLLHDLVEGLLDPFYIRPCGCMALQTPGTMRPTMAQQTRHLLANMSFYLLPAALILGLRRRTRKGR